MKSADVSLSRFFSCYLTFSSTSGGVIALLDFSCSSMYCFTISVFIPDNIHRNLSQLYGTCKNKAIPL